MMQQEEEGVEWNRRPNLIIQGVEDAEGHCDRSNDAQIENPSSRSVSTIITHGDLEAVLSCPRKRVRHRRSPTHRFQGYSLFLHEALRERADEFECMVQTDRIRLISRQWRSLPDQQRQLYSARAIAMNAALASADVKTIVVRPAPLDIDVTVLADDLGYRGYVDESEAADMWEYF